MITVPVDLSLFPDITASRECIGEEVENRLTAFRWKSGLERWARNETDPQTEVESVFAFAFPALHLDDWHSLLSRVLEEPWEAKEAEPQELHEFQEAIPLGSRADMLVVTSYAEAGAQQLHGFWADCKWSVEKWRAKAGEGMLHSFTERADSPAATVPIPRPDPESGEGKAQCLVQIEGVDKPLSLSDALAIVSNWEAVNERRVRLIDKKATKQITEEETAELAHLQDLAWAKRQMVMPLPLKELAAFEEALRRTRRWRDD